MSNIDPTKEEKKQSTEDDGKKKTTMKFFFLWFGIPMIACVALGWVMGHC